MTWKKATNLLRWKEESFQRGVWSRTWAWLSSWGKQIQAVRWPDEEEEEEKKHSISVSPLPLPFVLSSVSPLRLPESTSVIKSATQSSLAALQSCGTNFSRRWRGSETFSRSLAGLLSALTQTNSDILLFIKSRGFMSGTELCCCFQTLNMTAFRGRQIKLFQVCF